MQILQTSGQKLCLSLVLVRNRPEDRDSFFLQNTGIQPESYMAQQSSRRNSNLNGTVVFLLYAKESRENCDLRKFVLFVI
jgi:hypothetical protein